MRQQLPIKGKAIGYSLFKLRFEVLGINVDFRPILIEVLEDFLRKHLICYQGLKQLWVEIEPSFSNKSIQKKLLIVCQGTHLVQMPDK